MSGKSCSPRECLLTVRKWALVRPLAGMDPPMSRQRARVTKGLRRYVSQLFQRGPIVCVSYLAAAFAKVRLLTSVHSLVNREGRPLDKLLPAFREVANMRTDTAMDSLVPSQITASSERLAAGTARIGLCGGRGVISWPIYHAMR